MRHFSSLEALKTLCALFGPEAKPEDCYLVLRLTPEQLARVKDSKLLVCKTIDEVVARAFPDGPPPYLKELL